MKPVIIEKIPEPLNTWFDRNNFPEASRINIRTLQKLIKKDHLHENLYITEEEFACLEEWLKTLENTIGKWRA